MDRICTTCGEPFQLTGLNNRHAVCRSCRSAAAKAKYHSDPRALQIARSMNASLSRRAPG